MLILLAGAALWLGFAPRVSADILQVPGDYPTIQDALWVAHHGDEIVVADGTYSGPGFYDLDFEGLLITLRSASGDPSLCTLDCQMMGRAFTFDNDETADAILEGFTIANADWGGGLYNYPGSPTVTNCIFINNNKLINGAGMCNAYSSSPVVRDCLFLGNTAGDGGGGMLNYINCHPTLINCIFVGNEGDLGGGMRNYQSYPVLINCAFIGNQAVTGGGLYSEASQSFITNSILWNDAAGATPEVVNLGGSLAVIGYCDIEGCGGSGPGWNGSFGVDAGGNIDVEPLFTRSPAPGPDGTWGTEDDDYGDLHLMPGSPCIDSGDNTAVPEEITGDLDGNPRFVDDPDTEDTGYGEPPVVDMGAYEFQADPCPADFDGDGDVDTADLLHLLGCWGTGCGDVDGDGDTDTADLLALLGSWGECP